MMITKQNKAKKKHDALVFMDHSFYFHFKKKKNEWLNEYSRFTRKKTKQKLP